MMMPANYSVIAENEMTYVNGGASFIDAIGAVTAPIWDLTNVKAFSTNVVTMIGNAFIGDTIHNTLGYVFGGHATKADLGTMFGKVVGADKFKAGQYGDGIAQILGSAAAIYNLGRTEVKNTAGDVKLFPAKEAPKYTIKKNGNSLEIWG
uniref:hypothetical protein n=1 Tax=Faecalibacterium sp. TaxID=1971605 RepID=UPI003FED6978